MAGKSKKSKNRKRALARKLHDFAVAWREHARDELKIHKQLLSRKRSFAQHLRDTVRIHKKFLSKLKKL